MQKFAQALPAAVAAIVVSVLAIGLFVPKEFLPAWLSNRVPATLDIVPPSTAQTTASDEQAAESTRQVAAVPEDQRPKIDGESSKTSPAPPVRRPPEKFRPETDAELMNAFFTPLPRHPSEVPRVVDVPVPRPPNASAIWGGTGRDLQGRIWIGLCVHEFFQPSARLLCYDTATGEMADVGDVLSALKEHGLLRADNECQMKIHSKIIQAGDGHLYFASMDESGEKSDGSQLPTWGGHFWRLRMPERKWEHLHATPQALIAVAGMGRYVYALGYFDHIVVQFDTETGGIRTKTVGAVEGHVSRNLLADLRGHVYVPRVQRNDGAHKIEAALVEFDTELQEVGETKLEGYCGEKPVESHGITGVQPMADGSLAFVTHRGRLFLVVPNDSGPAEVKDLGWMHPLGEKPIESLFSYDGESWLMAAALMASNQYDWVAFDLKSQASVVHPLDPPARYAGVSLGLLLYGSTTRDAEGAFYLVGTSMSAAPYGPVLWRLMPPR